MRKKITTTDIPPNTVSSEPSVDKSVFDDGEPAKPFEVPHFFERESMCPKTMTGKHFWRAKRFQNGAVEPIFYTVCWACGMMDDRGLDDSK